MPTRADINEPLWRGDTVSIPFEIRSGGAPVSLEGAKVVFTMKLNPYAPDEAAELFYESEVAVGDTEGAAGNHLVTLYPSKTGVLQPAKHTYQLKVIWPGVPEPLERTYVFGHIPVEDS